MFTTSFPPVDDLIDTLTKIEYNKHLRNFTNVCIIFAACVAAVVSVICTRVAQWYRKGGKDDLQKAYNNCKNVVVDSYIWIRCEGYPELLKFRDDLQQTYLAWKDLVTV